MDFASFKALIAQYYIGRRHVLYLRTSNPVHAWAAYRTARTLEVAIPPWVLACFDAWATALTTGEYPSAKAIADALHIGKKGGETVTRKAARELRDLAIVADVLHLKDRPTRSEQEATLKCYRMFRVSGDVVEPGDRNLTEMMEDVAEKYELDYNSVKTIYYRMMHPIFQSTSEVLG